MHESRGVLFNERGQKSGAENGGDGGGVRMAGVQMAGVQMDGHGRGPVARAVVRPARWARPVAEGGNGSLRVRDSPVSTVCRYCKNKLICADSQKWIHLSSGEVEAPPPPTRPRPQDGPLRGCEAFAERPQSTESRPRRLSPAPTPARRGPTRTAVVVEERPEMHLLPGEFARLGMTARQASTSRWRPGVHRHRCSPTDADPPMRTHRCTSAGRTGPALRCRAEREKGLESPVRWCGEVSLCACRVERKRAAKEGPALPVFIRCRRVAGLWHILGHILGRSGRSRGVA